MSCLWFSNRRVETKNIMIFIVLFHLHGKSNMTRGNIATGLTRSPRIYKPSFFVSFISQNIVSIIETGDESLIDRNHHLRRRFRVFRVLSSLAQSNILLFFCRSWVSLSALTSPRFSLSSYRELFYSGTNEKQSCEYCLFSNFQIFEWILGYFWDFARHYLDCRMLRPLGVGLRSEFWRDLCFDLVVCCSVRVSNFQMMIALIHDPFLEMF